MGFTPPNGHCSAAAGRSAGFTPPDGHLSAAAIVIGVSHKVSSSSTLLIFGVMLGFIFSAATSVLAFSTSEHSLKLFYNWSSGSFSANTYTGTACMGAALLIGTSTAAWNAKGLDIILFGDEYSMLCGADARKIRAVAMVSCCLMTGMAISRCADIITQASHAAVPVGSAMAFIGIPVIIFILFKGKDA